MKTLKKSFALLTQSERKRGRLILVLVMGMALLETAGIASVVPFLAVLSNPEILNSNRMLSILFAQSHAFDITTANDFLIVLGLGAFMLIIFSAAYRTLTHYMMNRYIEMLRYRIGSRLLETYLSQPYAFFLDRHSGDLSKKILSEVDLLVGNVFHPVYNMFAYSLVLIAVIALLLLSNPWLTFLSGGLVGALYAIVFLGLRHKLTLLGGTLVSANEKRFLAASEAFGGIKEIKSLGQEQSYLSRFASASQQLAATLATNQTISIVPNFLIEALVFGSMLLLTVVLMLSYGGLGSDLLGQILPILGLYAFAALRLKPAVQAIYNGFANLRYSEATVDSLYADLYTENGSDQTIATASMPMIKPKHSISLQNLSYTYPNATNPTLLNINLEIPVGSVLGVVGSTGAGKTTLVDILIGLLRPTQGAITVDGVQVLDSHVRGWQKLLGYVPQHIFLTDTSIAENIAFGIANAAIDQAQVERCARIAQVHDFIMRDLPGQYETLVGERGVRLSGGQRQRIGIARALYRNPEVMIFDEATSSLDATTEQVVMDAIDALAHQKTIILLAHRHITLKSCDQIILLDQGTIRAKGSYDELIGGSAQFKTTATKGC